MKEKEKTRARVRRREQAGANERISDRQSHRRHTKILGLAVEVGVIEAVHSVTNPVGGTRVGWEGYELINKCNPPKTALTTTVKHIPTAFWMAHMYNSVLTFED